MPPPIRASVYASFANIHGATTRDSYPVPGIRRLPCPRRTIQNYDCPYHIILTNVKLKPRAIRSRADTPGPWPACHSALRTYGGRRGWRGNGPVASHRKGRATELRSAGHEYHPAGNSSQPQLLHDIIHFGQRPASRLASDFSRRAQAPGLPASPPVCRQKKPGCALPLPPS